MLRRSNCSIACSLDLLGDKWTLLILRDIVIYKKSRFEEFLESSEQIATSVLAERLNRLQEAGLVSKAPYGKHPLRMAYSPTAKGRSVAPLLAELARWGADNIAETRSPLMAMPADSAAMPG